MIQQEYKTIQVIADGDRIALRIEEDDSVTGILNLCWLTEKECDKLIKLLQKEKEKLEGKRLRTQEIIRTTDFTKMYADFEKKYNPYPVQMSRAEAFGRALDDGLIDKDTYYAAYKLYGNLWNYVGD